jgi:phytoene dehydrogenase-like protein
MKRVVILGGGIAGLTAAYRRKSEGETVVLEAGPAPGGSVKTVREDGFIVEGGPNTLRTSEAADRLLADLGLEPRVVKADAKAPRWIVRDGRPRAVVPGPGALFNTVFTTRGKLRLLKEPFVPGRPAISRMRSPDCNPDFSARLPGFTCAMRKPLLSSSRVIPRRGGSGTGRDLSGSTKMASASPACRSRHSAGSEAGRRLATRSTPRSCN